MIRQPKCYKIISINLKRKIHIWQQGCSVHRKRRFNLPILLVQLLSDFENVISFSPTFHNVSRSGNSWNNTPNSSTARTLTGWAKTDYIFKISILERIKSATSSSSNISKSLICFLQFIVMTCRVESDELHHYTKIATWNRNKADIQRIYNIISNESINTQSTGITNRPLNSKTENSIYFSDIICDQSLRNFPAKIIIRRMCRIASTKYKNILGTRWSAIVPDTCHYETLLLFLSNAVYYQLFCLLFTNKKNIRAIARFSH